MEPFVPGSTSRPSTRTVGEPRKRRCSAWASLVISITVTSAESRSRRPRARRRSPPSRGSDSPASENLDADRPSGPVVIVAPSPGELLDVPSLTLAAWEELQSLERVIIPRSRDNDRRPARARCPRDRRRNCSMSVRTRAEDERRERCRAARRKRSRRASRLSRWRRGASERRPRSRTVRSGPPRPRRTAWARAGAEQTAARPARPRWRREPTPATTPWTLVPSFGAAMTTAMPPSEAPPMTTLRAPSPRTARTAATTSAAALAWF